MGRRKVGKGAECPGGSGQAWPGFEGRRRHKLKKILNPLPVLCTLMLHISDQTVLTWNVVADSQVGSPSGQTPSQARPPHMNPGRVTGRLPKWNITQWDDERINKLLRFKRFPFLSQLWRDCVAICRPQIKR